MSEAEDKVGAALAKLNSSDDDYDSTLDEPEIDNTPIADDDSAEANGESSATDDDVNSGDTDDTTEKSDGDDDTNAEANGDSDSDVPDAYMRAAEHQGWKKEEVEEFWKSDQEKAERTLSKILESTNKLSAQWGQLGQQQMSAQVSPSATTVAADPASTVPAKSADETFAGLDIAKLKTEYDDDNLIDDVIKPMNDLLAKMDAKLKTVETQQTQTVQSTKTEQDNAAQEKKAVVGQQIDGFFNSLSSKEHVAFYGKGSDWSKFEGMQAENRLQLLTQADQIKIGADYQATMSGKKSDMTNEIAMNLANLIISADLAEQKIIGDIKNSLTKREKGLSLKPSGSRASSANDSKSDKSGKALENKVDAFMRKRGIKQY